ncbi:hypothetical protein BC332_20538 [Capsicum chinense]|nr:hypothetical protein BC332_20538 [Capsicum chinense]
MICRNIFISMLPDSLEWQELLISMGSVEYSGGITEVAQVTRCSDDRQRRRSPTPLYNTCDHELKPRKRLIKKLSVRESTPGFGIRDDYAYGGFTDDGHDQDCG